MFPFDGVIMFAVVVLNKQFRKHTCFSWWRHQMETFPRNWPFVRGNSPVPGEFPAQRPVTRSFDVFFDLLLNKPFSKQSWGCWFKTLSRPLWRHCNVEICDTMMLMWHHCNMCFFLHIQPDWGRDKMAAIFQTTFSNAFSWMKKYKFRLKFHWSEFFKVQLTTFQHWFR